MNGVINGNAAEVQGRRGWFLGHFISGDDARSTQDVEARWGVHQAGDEKPNWTLNVESTTISILIRGRFRLRFPAGDVLLTSEGDYALWQPGVPHHWVAEEESVVLTVRWPSKPGDAQDVEPVGAGRATFE